MGRLHSGLTGHEKMMDEIFREISEENVEFVSKLLKDNFKDLLWRVGFSMM